jgi:hypothetical protein
MFDDEQLKMKRLQDEIDHMRRQLANPDQHYRDYRGLHEKKNVSPINNHAFELMDDFFDISQYVYIYHIINCGINFAGSVLSMLNLKKIYLLPDFHIHIVPIVGTVNPLIFAALNFCELVVTRNRIH